MPADRCELCRGKGWVLDSHPERDPLILELIQCPIPNCISSGREIELISFVGPRLRSVSRHPHDGYVMSLSG
jgi:hypothetical protein